MPLHHWTRLLIGLMAVPAFALASDAVYDRADGLRWCLDHAVAAESPGLTDSLCTTVGIDGGALPQRLGDVVGGAVDAGWAPVEDLNFEYSSDGGMACFDPETQMVYVALGGGSRTLATVHLPSREQKVLEKHFPDAVSVHGRRIYIGRLKGKKYLSIFRGHDSSEHWRMELPADGRL